MRIRTWKLKKIHSIQPGKILYSDLERPATSLFSKKYQITGKPDYIIKDKDRFIPVELKFGRQNKPKKNHLLQLAGYCQLIEENYGGFVPYGMIIYNNKNQYKIPFNPKIRFELESTIKEMRKMLENRRISRNHEDSNRCINCSMKEYCSFIIK
jgi:CRISPR-associated exonuclease Cas4